MAATPLVLCDADNREIGHAHLAAAAFFDQAHAGNAGFVAGIACAHLIEEAAIDFVDDFQLARQEHRSNNSTGHFLERFGQQRVVGVGKGLLGDVPGLLPAEVASSSRMRINSGTASAGCVSLSWMATLSGSGVPIVVGAAETAHDVGQRAGDEEILLHEAQALAHAGGIVGIEHAGEDSAVESPQGRRRNPRC